MSTENDVDSLGPFAAGFASWRRTLAAASSHDTATKIFANAAAEAAGYVVRGLDRTIAADQLTQIAVAYGLDDVDEVQAIIANAFKRNGNDSAEHNADADFESGSVAPKAMQPSLQPKPRLFMLKAFEQITKTTAPNYLVKGLVPRAGLVVVWGPPKCGKSFWVFDLVMHIPLGWSYRGRRVKQGPVVYCALEGGHGFANRVEAWRERHLSDHHDDAVPFYLLDVPVDLIADRDRLIQAIKAKLGDQVYPVAIVIDTLNRALIGDENKSDDMAKFIRAADIIRVEFGCAVIVIHHCGVAANRLRGHTSLSGADDAQIAVERDEDSGIITATVEHMKDSEPCPPLASRLERVELGTDDDGDVLTSCVVVEADDEAATAKRPKLSAMEKLALDQLRELSADMGADGGVKPHPAGCSGRLGGAMAQIFLRQAPRRQAGHEKTGISQSCGEAARASNDWSLE
jgi:hypothetical protein